jgi:hypothetical protein
VYNSQKSDQVASEASAATFDLYDPFKPSVDPFEAYAEQAMFLGMSCLERVPANEHILPSPLPCATEIVEFTKHGGPLTKRIALSADGGIKNDSSACVMSRGTARRVPIHSAAQLANLIDGLDSNQAIALGRLRADLPTHVTVSTKAKGDGTARTNRNFVYQKGQAGWALLDFDSKGMPPDVATEIERLGGFWMALLTVLPDLEGAARVTRASTSTGLYHADTGEQLKGSGGLHTYVAVQSADDIERFLKDLHTRCWLAGLGWMMVGAAGQLLERSIVDRSVGGPERLVFEGAPILRPPLQQDQASRRAVAVSGELLDTMNSCKPLTLAEKAKLEELTAREAHRLASEAAKERAAFIERQTEDLITRGFMRVAAEQMVAKQCDGILLPNIPLPFDDPALKGKTVADVLADPGRFDGETLADPLEGVDYGRCKAKIMRRSDGTPWIHSFAHGRTIYELKLDAAGVRAAMEAADKEQVVKTFTRVSVDAELDAEETEDLRQLAHKLSGMGLRVVDAALKAAQEKKASHRAKDERSRHAAARRDPRAQVRAPFPDDEWLPQMRVLEDVVGKSSAPLPPARNIEGVVTLARLLRIPDTHMFTSRGANAEEEDEKTGKLPPPEQWVLHPLNDMELAELIERHIEYYKEDENGNRRSVHLASSFVKHYLQRTDSVMPAAVAVASLPIVLGDGSLLAPDGPTLDRDRGIVFVIPKKLRTPRPEDCTREAVAAAIKFLCDEWLVDVTTSNIGKCVTIAAALTNIERSLLDSRPVFLVTAARRGGGKTTLITMLILAVTGLLPAASAWSLAEEERRKVLLAQFLYGMPYILWDNIKRGTTINCPHIERACTSAFYADRKLGVTELIRTAASAIQFFTGNNIALRGDLASRGLHIRIDVDRIDPENREFEHPDPIAWTEDHRGKILEALYTILLGNPELKRSLNAPGKTRFKRWWRLVGSAVEHAARCAGLDCRPPEAEKGAAAQELDFKELFLAQEEDEEETATLADALALMLELWPNDGEGKPKTFSAKDIAGIVNGFDNPANVEAKSTFRDFLFPNLPPGATASSRAIGNRLRAHLDSPVPVEGGMRKLRKGKGEKKNDGGVYWVEQQKT